MRKLLTLILVLVGCATAQSQTIPINSPGTLGYGQSYSQDLGVKPAYGVYTLTFSVVNYLINYPGKYDVEFSFGTQQLCESYGWGTDSVQPVTVVCISPNYLIIDQALPGGGPVQGNKNLIVKWTVNDGSYNGGWPLSFSGVSLKFAPNGSSTVTHSVALSWTASISTVSGYNIYRSTTSGSGYTKLNSSLVTDLAYTDSNVQSGQTYYYVATAVDATGVESVFSNEVSAQLP